MKDDKPKYTTLQNVIWSLRCAKRFNKGIPFIIVAEIAVTVAYLLIDMYTAPRILQKLEQHAGMEQLLLTIAVFSLLLCVSLGFLRYINDVQNIKLSIVNRRLYEKLIEKQCSVSYARMLEPQTVHLREMAENTLKGNRTGPAEVYRILEALGETLFSFLAVFALLSLVSLPIALISLASAVIGMIAHQSTEMWYFKRRGEIGKLKGRISYVARVSQSVTAAKDIRIFSLGYWLGKVHSDAMDAYKGKISQYKRRQFRDDALMELLSLLSNGFAYAYLIGLVLKGRMNAAEFVLYFSAVRNFTRWITRFINTLLRMQRHCLDISAAREFLELKEPFRFNEGAPIPRKQTYGLKLENVSYRYPGAEEDSIKNVNLTIKAGEKLALVGLNGAGKTTLVKLLAGLIDPTEGRVLLDGLDVRDFDRAKYYELLSAVFQDYSIPDFTIAENVSMRLSAETDRSKVLACLDRAGLTDKLSKMANGIDTPVGREAFEDGTLFSGGECQRLLLARALYKDAPILLLDEPTAALDPLAEHEMYMKYSVMSQGKTSLFISHRLASTRFCDRIVLLEGGRIAEEGTHDGLLSRGGKYKELFDMQSRYYREGVEF